MRTTLNLEDALFEKAAKLTGIKEKTRLLHEGLRSLIEKESARRLASLGGSAPKLKDIPRRYWYWWIRRCGLAFCGKAILC